jgi:[ribosomal protein S18]-alanine N-acetyltransferase
MTPQALAAIHAACFVVPRPWSEAEFAALLANPTVFLLTDSAGFLMARVVAEEAELLTLAVTPPEQRRGIGRRLVSHFLNVASTRGATRAFLEVSEKNVAAIGLYRALGFQDAGRRKRYYRDADGQVADALVLSCNLQG